MPFGFSVSDFIGGISLVVKCLKVTHGREDSAASFQTLQDEITSLENSLNAVASLKLQGSGFQQVAQLEKSVEQCNSYVDTFVKSIDKYQGRLSHAKGWRRNIWKVSWRLCKSDEVLAFKSQLKLHLATINALLSTLQISERRDVSDVQRDRHNEVLERLGGSTEQLGGRIEHGNDMIRTLQSNVLDAMQSVNSISTQQGDRFERLFACFEDMVRNNRSVPRDKLQLLAQATQIQHYSTVLPPQVKLQEPIVLLDACAHETSFRLDFVVSKEAFLAVLRDLFAKKGVSEEGLTKLDRSEFMFHDDRWARDITFSRPWESLFRPGQSVSMTMSFSVDADVGTCPGCGRVSAEDDMLHFGNEWYC